MRPATTLEILRRAINGEHPDRIATTMHIGKRTVHDQLRRAGWPDTAAVTAYRHQYGAGDRQAWAWADTIAGYAQAIRVNPEWVHAATLDTDREELRALLAIAVAMLPADIHPRDALAWIDEPGTVEVAG